MAEESKSGASSFMPSSGVVALLLVAAGAFFVAPPLLKDLRPAAGEPRIQEPPRPQDVQARLWQDPLGAVERTRKAAAAASAGAVDAHIRSPLADLPKDAPCGTPDVLAVTLDGSAYTEPVETRRRTRYAVLSALNASGWAPDDTEHLGYFLTPRPGPAPAASPLQYAVPYEWLQTRPNRDPGASCHRLLLLWVDAHLIAGRPLAALSDLARRMTADAADGRAAPRWLVIGPNGSDALRDMAVDLTPGTRVQAPAGMRIYSNTATVPDRVLLEATPQRDRPTDLRSAFEAAGIALRRTIGDDTLIAAALVAELQRRGLQAHTLSSDPAEDRCDGRSRPPDAITPDTVAIVADWDTLYGRTQRIGLEARRADADGPHPGFCIVPFSYVRGLDGQLPDASAEGASKSADAKGGSDKPSAKADTSSQIERAEGQAQLDYLRRLAGQMHDRDELLRQAGKPRGFRAIGVLGNDLHDKLLVLQMLRREFPDVLFFATDLDARYLHPTEQAWTRNLVVASSFGLELAPGLQRDIPPMRDSYQTSAFFATRFALADAGLDAGRTGPDPKCLADALSRPRVFEVGRTRAFDYSDDASGLPDAGACGNVHAPGSALYANPPLGKRLATAGLLLLGFGLLAFIVSPTLRSGLGWPSDPTLHDPLPSKAAPDQDERVVPGEAAATLARNRRLKLGMRGALVLVALAAFVVAGQWDRVAGWLTQGGKPMWFTEGISTWPTEIVRALTLLLCIYLIGRGWVSLSRGMDDIARDFRLVSRQRLQQAQAAGERRLRRSQRLANIFAPRLVAAETEPGDLEGLSRETVRFWKLYIVQSRLRSRLVRVAALVLLMVTALLMLYFAAGSFETTPSRGTLSIGLDRWLPAVLFTALLALLFFVADATWFCVKFVRHLTTHAHTWPASTLAAFQARFDLPERLLPHWINLAFIRHRTACIVPLVYHPFIVLSLLLLARNPYFDNWNLSAVSKVSIGLCALVAIGCALTLRRTAEKARASALREIDESIIRARGLHRDAAPPFPIEQAMLLRQRIVEMREGAFAPYTQQPLLRAALLPFAALGGPSLLDALSLINL